MKEVVKDKFKVLKIEEGLYEYDTLFIDVNKESVQIPILKTKINNVDIVGKIIKVPCEIIENGYIFNKVITEIELDK